MKPREVMTIASNLSASVGPSWPVVLLKSLGRTNAAFRRTHWSNAEGPESDFVRRIRVAPPLLAELGRKLSRDEALEVMQELLVSIGCAEQWDHLHSIRSAHVSGMEELMAFHDLMDQKGAPRFNHREYVRQDEDVCHFRISRCVFHDFFVEAGAPELTKAFCEVDRRFFPEAFPDFRFHRGDSWENTIAYGEEQCEFVFERIDSLSRS